MGGSPEGGSSAAGLERPGRAARLARLRVQLLRRRAARPAGAVPALPGARALPRGGGREARAHPGGGHAPHDQGVALPLLALLRRLPAGLPARGLPRQRHSAALGQPRAGERSVPELGGVPHDRRRSTATRGRRSRCCATASARCCTAATRSACATWPATRTCSRSASTWRRRSMPTASTARQLVESIFRECLHRRGEARIPEGRGQAAAARRQRAQHRLDRGRAGAAGAHHLPAQQPLPARRSAARVRARPRAREIADVREEILGREA